MQPVEKTEIKINEGHEVLPPCLRAMGGKPESTFYAKVLLFRILFIWNYCYSELLSSQKYFLIIIMGSIEAYQLKSTGGYIHARANSVFLSYFRTIKT